jgi:hypothetical protein
MILSRSLRPPPEELAAAAAAEDAAAAVDAALEVAAEDGEVWLGVGDVAPPDVGEADVGAEV